jgi:hypothetical protein
MEGKCIGVSPAAELTLRRNLWMTLEQALPVRFVELGAGLPVDAAILLGDGAAPGPHPVPTLTVSSGEAADGQPAQVELRDHPRVDARLRGLVLGDAGVAAAAGLTPDTGDAVLASRGRDAMWCSRGKARGRRDTVVASPAELEPGEALRDRLREGRFLALAALVQFLRDVSAEVAYTPPPPRACFLFDDPNLRWSSYGFVNFPELVREADRHGYHVAFAMIPLDARFTLPAACRLFRERADRLSLSIHGNNHEYVELGRASTRAAAHAVLSQALTRIAAFERRSGVEVARIMIPPHGVCSQEVVCGLAPLGYEALCISRPYPWLARPPHSWLRMPEDSSPLSAWQPASVVENGLPVILRRGFFDPPEDLPLRAFLDQPLIIHGHHQDIADGPELLSDLAGRISALGDVRWCSLKEIAATNYATRLDGSLLRVRLFSRRAVLDVPEEAERIAVEVPALQPGGNQDEITLEMPGGGADALVGPWTAVQGGSRITLRLRSAAPVRPACRPTRRVALGPVIRRTLTETRDRLMPVYRRARGSA